MSTWRITTKYCTNKVVSFYPDVFLGCVPVLTERPDGHYCIENGMVTDNVGLNFSEPDNIICQNHVYDPSFLFLREYGPPSSFQVHLINVVFFFRSSSSSSSTSTSTSVDSPSHPPSSS